MQRARRLAPIAVVVAVGIITLTGCRSQPDVAAYLGDQRITEDRVTGILDEVKQKPGQAPAAPEGAPLPLDQSQPLVPSRAEVVSLLVFNDACSRFSQEKGLKAQRTFTVQDIAGNFPLSAETEYAQQLADAYTCRSSLPAAQPATPTKQELDDLVRDARAAGLGENGETDAQLLQGLDGEQFRGALGQRDQLEKEFGRFDIVVNPRYRPLEYPLLQFPNQDSAVGVPLGEPDTGVVTDRR